MTHKEIFANPDHLPTFSSPAIEINMHRIPGLSNQFIYSNDDYFLMRPICPVKFWNSFTETRGHHDPLKAAFHCFQNCSIPKAVNPKSSLSILISKAQKPISKNRVLSLEIEKNFGNFFGLLPRDWTKIGGRFLTHHFKLKDRSLYLTNGTLYQNSMKWDLLGSLYGF